MLCVCDFFRLFIFREKNKFCNKIVINYLVFYFISYLINLSEKRMKFNCVWIIDYDKQVIILCYDINFQVGVL